MSNEVKPLPEHLKNIKNPFAVKHVIFSLVLKDKDEYAREELYKGKHRFLFILSCYLTDYERDNVDRIVINKLQYSDSYSVEDIVKTIKGYFIALEILITSNEQELSIL